jgi:membrane protein YdbS with pleckstrin-like domain
MYCTKCGADNSETAVYCRKCGALLEKEEETRVARRPLHGELSASVSRGDQITADDDDRQIFSIGPTLLFVKAGYVMAAIGALFLVAITSAYALIGNGWAVFAGLLLFLIPALYHVKQKLLRYTLTETKLEIDEGLISRRTKNLPIRRIQDVTVSTSILQRLLGFGDLVVDNASDDGEKITLRNINKPRRYADMLLRQMKRLEK